MKGPAFRKGHIVREEDVEQLLNMGKEHIYVWDIQSDSGLLHENEAAVRIARAAAGRNIALSAPEEGKVDLTATVDGLLKIDVEALFEINAEEIVFASLHTHQRVGKGKILAGTRVIPLVIGSSVSAHNINLLSKSCRSGVSTSESLRPGARFSTAVSKTNSVPSCVKNSVNWGAACLGRPWHPTTRGGSSGKSRRF
jgi:hypothetical protein